MPVQPSAAQHAFALTLAILAPATAVLFSTSGEPARFAGCLLLVPLVPLAYMLRQTVYGAVALLGALSVSLAVALDAAGFANQDVIRIGAVGLFLWGLTLSSCAIVRGIALRRSDDGSELSQAYVGALDILAAGLRSADPVAAGRPGEVGRLSALVAREMGLPANQIDGIRAAALLAELERSVTTRRVLRAAVEAFSPTPLSGVSRCRRTNDLARSLAPILDTALPLLARQSADPPNGPPGTDKSASPGVALNEEILSTVRSYVSVMGGESGGFVPETADGRRRTDAPTVAKPETVIDALERVVRRPTGRPEPAAELPLCPVATGSAND